MPLRTNSRGSIWGIRRSMSAVSNDERSLKVMQALAASPQANNNAACGGWAETTAAYPFINNDLVTPEKTFQPHRDATL